MSFMRFDVVRPVGRAKASLGLATVVAMLLAIGTSASAGDAPETMRYSQLSGDPSMLLLQAGELDPVTKDFALAPGFDQQSTRTSFGPKYFIVQFDGAATVADLDGLRSRGWEVLDYVPNNAYIVRTSTGAGTADLIRDARLRWSSELLAGMKIATEVIGEVTTRSAGETTTLVVTIWKDEERKDVANAVIALGGDVVRADQGYYSQRLMVRLPVGLVADLASMEEVQWLETIGEFVWRNNSATQVTQTGGENGHPLWDRGLHGEGQVVGHIDGALQMTSCYFSDTPNTPGPTHRKVVAYRGSGTASSHGTHTAGTSAGKNVSGDLNHAGHAYEAKISHSAFNAVTGVGSDIETNLDSIFLAAQSDGAFVHTNSWGIDGIRNYTFQCNDIDTVSWNNEDALVMFAETNANVQLYTPENAKNVLAVGNAQHAPNQMNRSGCGIGPTTDGRRKPEIFAPGTSTVSASTAACGTTSSTGTSMACPAVTGNAALVRQYFMDGFYPSGLATPGDALTPSGSLVKAALLNSAIDMTSITGYPSNQEGWGLLALDNSLYFDGETRKTFAADRKRVDGEGLLNGEFEEFSISVLSSDEPFRVTLVWHDPPVARNTTFTPVNNLDLTVIAPDGTFLGNVFTAGQSSTGGTADTLNNVEVVLLNTPTPGAYLIRVEATAVNALFPEQGFAVVANGDLGAGTRGIVRFDAEAYACGGVATITVNDGNVGAAMVNVTLETEGGDSETIVATETLPGTYVGTIVVSDDAVSTGNGSLEVASGGEISASYEDLDTGTGSETITALSSLDCDAPRISTVAFTDIRDISARLTFNADESIAGTVLWGTSCGTDEGSAPIASTGGGNYEALLTGLTEGTRYFTRLEVADGVGNPTVDDNGGDCFAFTTLVRETFFEADFEPDQESFTVDTATGPAWVWQVDGLAHSPTHVFFVTDHTTTQDSRLVSPPAVLPDGPSTLTFWHTYQFETPDWDGGVIEISTNGGGSWSDLGSRIVRGNYTGTIRSGTANPLTGRAGWIAGTSGVMTEVEVDLADFANQTVNLRWRIGADISAGNTGWRVDDILISRFVQGEVPATIEVDGEAYACGTACTVTVVDENAGVSTLEVLFESGIGDAETVMLAETDPGVFVGMISVEASELPNAGNGTLELASGASFTATYTDTTSGSGMEMVSTTGNLDCDGPVLALVAIADVTETTARVSFMADEPITGVAAWGISCGDTSAMVPVSVSGPDAYEAMLTGLEPGTEYFVRLLVSDELGNLTNEDDEGRCHSFFTLAAPGRTGIVAR